MILLNEGVRLPCEQARLHHKGVRLAVNEWTHWSVDTLLCMSTRGVVLHWRSVDDEMLALFIRDVQRPKAPVVLYQRLYFLVCTFDHRFLRKLRFCDVTTRHFLGRNSRMFKKSPEIGFQSKTHNIDCLDVKMYAPQHGYLGFSFLFCFFGQHFWKVIFF